MGIASFPAREECITGIPAIIGNYFPIRDRLLFSGDMARKKVLVKRRVEGLMDRHTIRCRIVREESSMEAGGLCPIVGL